MRKFFALSAADRWLVTKAFVAVASIRVALWCLPFRRLRPLLDRLAAAAPTRGVGEGESIAGRVAWAVGAAAHRVPHASCLTQALAAEALLARRGESSRLHVGVARDERRGVIAHAWLESGGRIVIGGGRANRYVPLTPLAEVSVVQRVPTESAARSTPPMEVG